MIEVEKFVFNPFQENTYLLYDNSKECVVIDAGCYSDEDFDQIFNYISSHNLKLVKLINTHGHIDHIMGLPRLSEHFNLIAEFHKEELYLINQAVEQGKIFGINLIAFPKINTSLQENTDVTFGHSILKVLHVPGHTKGSVAFVSESDKFIITGDVLFKGSIGRTDLSGGDFNILMNSITNKLLKFNDDFLIYPGHGPSSTIGEEKVSNPFLIS